MFKVDVFAVKDRPYDRMALSRRRRQVFDESSGLALDVASAEDVVLGKLAASRNGDRRHRRPRLLGIEDHRGGGASPLAMLSERQWLDVLGVLRVQAGRLDVDYLRRWAGELGVADLFERAWGDTLDAGASPG